VQWDNPNEHPVANGILTTTVGAVVGVTSFTVGHLWWSAARRGYPGGHALGRSAIVGGLLGAVTGAHFHHWFHQRNVLPATPTPPNDLPLLSDVPALPQPSVDKHKPKLVPKGTVVGSYSPPDGGPDVDIVVHSRVEYSPTFGDPWYYGHTDWGYNAVMKVGNGYEDVSLSLAGHNPHHKFLQGLPASAFHFDKNVAAVFGTGKNHEGPEHFVNSDGSLRKAKPGETFLSLSKQRDHRAQMTAIPDWTTSAASHDKVPDFIETEGYAGGLERNLPDAIEWANIARREQPQDVIIVKLTHGYGLAKADTESILGGEDAVGGTALNALKTSDDSDSKNHAVAMTVDGKWYVPVDGYWVRENPNGDALQ
jgi:hypothetical protein